MSRKAIVVCALIASAGGALPYHYVEYGMALSLGPDYFEEYITAEQSNGLMENSITIPSYGFVSGKANVGYGVNKAAVTLRGDNESDPLNFAYGFATSLYFDSVLIEDPELNGTMGSFVTNLYVEGQGFFDVSSGLLASEDTQLEGFWHAVINIWGNSIDNQSVYYAGDWLKDFGSTEMLYSGDPLNTQQQEATFEFMYGEEFYVQTFIQTEILIDNQTLVPGTMDATIDLANSAYWGGMRNFRDSNGNPVSEFGYSSSSGFNYLVPEPGGFMALLAGLGVFGMVKRFRRSVKV